MNNEIERKFLVKEFDPIIAYDKIKIIQGYLFSKSGKVVRVRTFNEKAYITVKYRVSPLKRMEFEYEIPFEDALIMIENCCEKEVLEKTRYLVLFNNKKWEVDVFEGKNEGLILAEIELLDEEETFLKPDFVLDEVTGNPKYSNHNLAKI